jgi:hypothetical protein
MRIGDLFETRVEEKIEPVIKVSEIGDARKLAAEIGSYVVTPLIERHLDDFMEHYSDTFFTQTTEIGVWISGYFGSGKSHLAKIMALLVENRVLEGVSACERFEARVPPDAPRRNAILRSLKRMDQCQTQVLAFNLNVLVGDKDRPLPGLLLSQYYLSRGYSNNLVYARVIEAELERQGKLEALHAAVEARANKKWADVQRNLSFYSAHLYAAACDVAPEVFASPQDVARALQEAEQGEIYNVDFLVRTMLADLAQRERAVQKPQRILLVLDESGQWIQNHAGRLAQLQALIEEAANRGQGKIWIIVTTHGDLGSVYKEARALEGDMKKIEGRFRFKPALTTENIELVLEDRLFKKSLAGQQALETLYTARGGVLRGLGELANTSQTLPACTADRFAVYYPFFPYQVHLIPEVVKSLRSKGGRGEQMSGSTRTLLAITQDVLRAGRRPYLDEPLGALVSLDEIYHNLVGEGEIGPDARTEISRIKDVVPDATDLTSRVAEVLYLVRELPYIPRTRDNVARLLVESVDDDLSTVLARVEPELTRLIQAKLVARIGEEYEFLTGERRTFEEEVTTVEAQYRQQDRERGLVTHFVQEAGQAHWRKWLGSNTVRFHEQDFYFKLVIDGGSVPGTQGHVTLKLTSPLVALTGLTLTDLEDKSLRSDEEQTIFVLCGRVSGFDQDLTRFLAMKEVINNWKGDPRKSEEARKLARDRESDDLPKLEARVLDGLKEGLRTAHVIFRGGSRSLVLSAGQTPESALHSDMAAYWPVLYPKFGRVPTRISNERRAIQDVLAGATRLASDVQALKLYDKGGQIDLNSPLLGDIRMYLATEQNAGRRVLGQGLLAFFGAPPYGWDPNAVRVGVAALVRAGAVRVLINKKPYTNPEDRELVAALRGSRDFNKVALVLEETEIDPDTLTETRAFLIHLAKRRDIDETPAALSEAAGALAAAILAQADTVHLWAGGSQMPLAPDFVEGEEAWTKVAALSNPIHRVREVHTAQATLKAGFAAIEAHAAFQAARGVQFTEMVQLKGQLEAVEYRVQGAEGICAFLAEYRTVEKQARFTDQEVWKRLQSRKAQALLELAPLLERWRDDARQRLDDALARLPDDLAQQQLVPTLHDELAGPLVTLREGLKIYALPAQVADLPERAAQIIKKMGLTMLGKAADKERSSEPVDRQTPQEKRPLRKLRASDVVTVTRVRNKAEWEILKVKLDQRVRALLDEGYDVELS